ncbi:galactose-binding domain-containing protein [Flavicella sediminum]|uniref:galactose-binding domain-containing protein n=1 Tax=Flavicella sediminum TaxID=2585141 RepID=UPI00111FC5BD|nr:discoidin domain-containing protein [Flavicella sediminum]
MRIEKYTSNFKSTWIVLLVCCVHFTGFAQKYVNDMDYVLGDTKQAFITNKVTTQTQVDNLLLGFKNMGVNGVRIPLFGRDVNGVDLNPNKQMFDYFYIQALAQGFVIFANPAQGGGGHRVANNRLNGNGATEGEDAGVKGVQAATDELVNRVIEFSNTYPNCKWINPFNEDGRATNSTWSISQINEIYQRLYNHGLNGAELIGPCTWGLVAGIDMLKETRITDYITVATAHNLGFNHNLWDDFIALADAESLPVWDSEVNHNDAKGTGTRLEKAIENKVDGLVLYNSWNTISLTTGSINAGGEAMMALYLDEVEKVNLALSGFASQSSTNPSFNKEASLAIDGDTNGNFGSGSVTVTNSEANPWWQVDLGSNKTIGEIKVYNRTDGCCKANMSNFTVSVINSSGVTTYSKTYDTYPDPSVVADAGGVQGRIIKIQLNATAGLTLAEVQVFAPDELSVGTIEDVNVSAYPNPVVDKLTVETPDVEFDRFTLFTINGQIILKGDLHSTSNEIDMSTFSKGIYVLKLEGAKYAKTFKVVKE